MANSDSPAPAPPTPPLFTVKTEKGVPLTPKLEEFNEAQRDLLSKVQNLKQDLHGWRSKLDAQASAYQNDLSDLKSSIDTEVRELRKAFQYLIDDMQKQQEATAECLRSFGLRPEPNLTPKVEVKEEARDRPPHF